MKDKVTVEYVTKNDMLLVFYRGKTGIEWNWLSKGCHELVIDITYRDSLSSYINPNNARIDIISLPIKRLLFKHGEYETEIGVAGTTPYERKALAIDIFKTLKFRGRPFEITRELVFLLEIDYEMCERSF